MWPRVQTSSQHTLFSYVDHYSCVCEQSCSMFPGSCLPLTPPSPAPLKCPTAAGSAGESWKSLYSGWKKFHNDAELMSYGNNQRPSSRKLYCFCHFRPEFWCQQQGNLSLSCIHFQINHFTNNFVITMVKGMIQHSSWFQLRTYPPPSPLQTNSVPWLQCSQSPSGRRSASLWSQEVQ